MHVEGVPEHAERAVEPTRCIAAGVVVVGAAVAGGGPTAMARCRRTPSLAPTSRSCRRSIPDRRRPIHSAGTRSTSSTCWSRRKKSTAAGTATVAEPEAAQSFVLIEPEPERTEEVEAAMPEPVTAEPQPAHEDPVVSAPEPAPPASEPEPVIAANDIAPEPAVKPIIIGSEETAVVEKKRGWWRR